MLRKGDKIKMGRRKRFTMQFLEMKYKIKVKNSREDYSSK